MGADWHVDRLDVTEHAPSGGVGEEKRETVVVRVRDDISGHEQRLVANTFAALQMASTRRRRRAVSEFRASQVSRVLLAILLLFSLMGGTGVAVADREHNRGRECPSENPNQAFEHASEFGIENSALSRATALEATKCVP